MKITAMFVDEAGETTGSHFVAGMFATQEPEAWRRRIDEALPWYPYSLHYHKIGARSTDGRFRATNAVLDLLDRHRDWYAHYLRIDRRLVDTTYFSNRDQIEFNYWVGQLIERRTARRDSCFRVLIADRDRNHADGYLPTILGNRLDARYMFGEGPHVEIGVDLAKNDRLLQLGDLIGSAARQVVVPGPNPNKRLIADRVASMVRPATGAARPNQRIYGWDWRPNPR